MTTVTAMAPIRVCDTRAGRLWDVATGSWVLDGPMNNAMAHFLHSLL